MQTGIQDWTEALMTSLAAALALFLAAIPRIIGFLLVIIIGWLIASALAKAVGAILRRVDFDGLARRSGFSDFVHKTGVHTDASGFIAGVTKWFIRLIVLVVAFDVLGLPAVSAVLQELLLWLPNLVVALVVLVIGGLVAGAVSGLVRGATAEADLGNPDLLAKLASATIWAFAIIVAVNQLGIATTLVNTLFMATVFALALAVGLAFGLGGRETAGEIVRNWYNRGRAAAPRMANAREAATDQARARERERVPANQPIKAPIVDETEETRIGIEPKDRRGDIR
ncbi:MAG: mechanosensitive ion channel family protein [Longimicrobiaceae bacterium]